MFTTNGVLSKTAILTVTTAMDKFLLAELNAIYQPQWETVMVVKTEVVNNNTVLIHSGKRRLQGKIGTQLEMMLEVGFQYQPAPMVVEIESNVVAIMSNLTYFVSNLTAYGLEELKFVTEAYRKELPTSAPTQAPNANSDKIVAPPTTPNAVPNNNSGALKAVSGALSSAALVAVLAYFIFRRRKQESVQSPKGDMLYVDFENENYSQDRSLESPVAESPFNADSVQSSIYTSNYSSSGEDRNVQSPLTPLTPTSPGAGDSVFSGIDSPTNTNPYIRSTKSLMSGYTHTSASTIRVSNINEHEAKLLRTQQRFFSSAPQGSLFAFSEEGEDADSDRMDSQPSLDGSDVSESSQVDATAAAKSKENATNLQVKDEDGTDWAGTAPDVLNDLIMTENRQPPPRDPTPQMREANNARDPTPRASTAVSGVMASVLGCTPSCNPAMPSPSLTNVSGSEAYSEADPPNSNEDASIKTPRGNVPSSVGFASVKSSIENPVTRNFASSVTTPNSATATVSSQKSRISQGSAKAAVGERHWKDESEDPKVSVGQMSAKATQVIGGVYGVGGMFRNRKVQKQVSSKEEGNTTGRAQSRGRTRDDSQRSSRSRSLTALIHRPRNLNRARSARSLSQHPTSPTDERSHRAIHPSSPTETRSNRTKISTDDKSPVGYHESSPTEARSNRSSKIAKDPQGFLKGGTEVSSPPDDGDYVNNLSRPSTPGDEFNTSIRDYVSDGSNLHYRKMRSHLQDDGGFPTDDERHRRHVENMGADGSAMYQANAMHPLDWSYKSAEASVGDSTISDNDGAGVPSRFSPGKKGGSKSAAGTESRSEHSRRSHSKSSPGSRASRSSTGEVSHASASRQLINDLVWLEKKIADVKKKSTTVVIGAEDPPAIETVDSLSYVSNDAFVSPASTAGNGMEEATAFTGRNDSVTSSIVCRDCYAPPGKLHIVIHSTKDGPAVHTVKDGSSLQGHIFPGDLIISVDDVDTRSYSAEQVMKMMAARSDKERKITVLHFEVEE